MSPRSGRIRAALAVSLAAMFAAPAALGASPLPSASPDASPSSQPTSSAGPLASPTAAPIPCPGIDPTASGLATAAPIPAVSPSTSPSAAPSILTGSPQPSSSPAIPSPAPSLEPCMPAQPNTGLGAGPSQVILDLDHRSGQFGVYNAGDLEEQVTLTPHDLYVDENGEPQVASLPMPQGASAWLRFPDLPERTFVLKPGESRTVRFLLDVPESTTPGDHASRIVIRGVVSPEAWAHYRAAYPQAGNGINVLSAVEFPVDTVIRVPGPIIPDLQVPGFEVFLPSLVSTTTGDFTFRPEIVNTGNVAAVWMPRAGAGQTLESVVPTLQLAPNGGLFAQRDLLFDGHITGDGAVSLSPLVVLPGASYKQRLTFRDAPLFGTYDYIYRVPGSVADGRADIIKTGSFTIINLQKVLYWIVLPLLALMVLMALTLMGRRRRTLNRRAAEALRQREIQQARMEAYQQAYQDQAMQGRHGR